MFKLSVERDDERVLRLHGEEAVQRHAQSERTLGRAYVATEWEVFFSCTLLPLTRAQRMREITLCPFVSMRAKTARTFSSSFGPFFCGFINKPGGDYINILHMLQPRQCLPYQILLLWLFTCQINTYATATHTHTCTHTHAHQCEHTLSAPVPTMALLSMADEFRWFIAIIIVCAVAHVPPHIQPLETQTIWQRLHIVCFVRFALANIRGHLLIPPAFVGAVDTIIKWPLSFLRLSRISFN